MQATKRVLEVLSFMLSETPKDFVERTLHTSILSAIANREHKSGIRH
jgi:hypothetical protein